MITAADCIGIGRHRVGVALDEAAHSVAITSVPDRPAIADERADLVKTSCVPGFSDDLGPGQHRVGVDVPQDGRVFHGLAVLAARQDRGEIEAKPIHMHLLHPVAQAIHDHSAHDGVVAVKRIAYPAIVDILGPVVRVQHVVDPIVNAAQRDRGPVVTVLGRVVEDHIEDDFDAGAVQGLDHVAELIHRSLANRAGTVLPVRCKEGDRLVAPVVGSSTRRGLRIELEDRKQLDNFDAELLEIGDFLDQTGVRAARVFRQAGAGMLAEAALRASRRWRHR